MISKDLVKTALRLLAILLIAAPLAACVTDDPDVEDCVNPTSTHAVK